MPEQGKSNSKNILLLEFTESLARALRNALPQQTRVVKSEPNLPVVQWLGLIERQDADLVFCAAESSRCKQLLEEVRREKPGLPVVVVSSIPEVSEWLDAMEAGAADYCAPPFESAHIQWIVRGALRPGALAA